jgi:hypothetical protein
VRKLVTGALVLVVALGLGISLAVAASAPTPVSGVRCSVAHEAQYQRDGFVCIEAKNVQHRLARIVAEPATRPRRVKLVRPAP